MNKIIKYGLFGISILLLFYAFDAMIFKLITPILNPGINTLTDNIIRAFISIFVAVVILFSLSKAKND